ncbi:diguanylate cyclase domain-containing protein [Micromonosporaceae bacterium Da 78-11]
MPGAVDGGAPPLWRDRALVVFAVSMVVVLGAYVLDLGSHRAQILGLWLIMPVLDALLLVFSARVARAPGLAKAPRRFWRTMTLAALIFTIGDGYQLVSTLADAQVEVLAPTVPQNLAMLIGAGMLVAVGITYPTGPRSRAARIRFLLDAAIVNCAAGVVTWCLMTRPTLAGAGPDAVISAVFGCGLLLVGVFITVKMGLTHSGPMIAGAALPVIAGAAAQALANVIIPGDDDGQHLGLHVILMLAPCFLAVFSPRIQELRGLRRPGPRDARTSRRRYSLLPYAATVVSATALVVSLAVNGLGLQAWGALAGLLAGIALVVGRQVLALAENGTLLDRLDDSLVEIRRREQRLESLLRHSSDITSVIGAGGVFSYVSPAVETVLGVPAGTVVGRPMLDLLHPDDRVRLAAELRDVFDRAGATLTYQARFRRSDGTWRWLEVFSVNLVDGEGVGGVVSNAHDITEARELQERLRFQAEHDSLTSLANRRRFADRMRETGPGDAAVLLIDLDGFKEINDSYGHASGDAVLVHVAERLRGCAGPGDLPARLGGDEFAVLLAHGDRAAAERMAHRFRDSLVEPVAVMGRLLRVGASVGVAIGPAGDPDHLLHAADLQMYEQKLSARVRVP